MQTVSRDLSPESSLKEKHYEEMDRVWDLLTKQEQDLIHEESFAWAKSEGLM